MSEGLGFDDMIFCVGIDMLINIHFVGRMCPRGFGDVARKEGWERV